MLAANSDISNYGSISMKRNIWIVLQPVSVLFSLVLVSSVSSLLADELSWNHGDGSFFVANNWNPSQVPQNGDVFRIGNLPGTAGSTVLMGGVGTVQYGDLHLSNGVTLDLNGSELISSMNDAFITGNGTRLIARPAAFLNPADFQGRLQLGPGATLDLRDNVLVILTTQSNSSGTISGRGDLLTLGFNNNGVLQPGNNGGMAIVSMVDPPLQTVDLDGSADTGSLQLTTMFSQLEVEAGSLPDSFSGSIAMAPGALLDMNIVNGWTADANSLIAVSGFNNVAASQIVGSPLTFGGTMNVTLALGKLRVAAPITINSTASVNVGHTDRLEFDGITTVVGGNFSMGQFAELEFDGPTTLNGGTFNTFSDTFADGAVNFNGSTVWSGNVDINGNARQNGYATVTAPTVINVQRIDMDGNANTFWDINSSLVVNAIDTGSFTGDTFGGTFDIGNGLITQLAVNLADSDATWTMAGEMFLANNAPFQSTRVAGSRMQVTGDLNVNGANVRITADTDIEDGSTTFFQTANSSLVMRGTTTVQSGALFMGTGTFINGTNGQLRLEGGASLNELGLRNQGLLEIGDAAGIADVASFESTADARWQVEIGGHVAGNEHDVLLVGNGDAILDGRLSVKLIDAGNGPFVPQVGDEFTILSTVDSVVGQFDNAPISIAGGDGYQWEVLYNSNVVTLRVASIIPNLVLGDVNMDGIVSLLDVAPFVNAVTTGTYIIQADINCDGAVDLLDVSLFVALQTG